jgi:glucose dehydrogenase
VFYGTLEGYLKAVDAETGEELYRFKTPSGIIGNVTTYSTSAASSTSRCYSGVGGWAGIGLAAGLVNPNDGLGAVGATPLSDYTQLGGQMTVFALPTSVGGPTTRPAMSATRRTPSAAPSRRA